MKSTLAGGDAEVFRGGERGFVSFADGETLNKKLFERLVAVVGTAEDIKLRQQIFTIMNAVNGLGDDDSVSISAGSLSEGLDLKGSDEDIMIILKYVDVVPDEIQISSIPGYTMLKMEEAKRHPGYAKLTLPDGKCDNRYIICSLQESDKETIVSSSRFRSQFIESGTEEHGPCISDGVLDFAMSISGKRWPLIAKNRILTCKSKRWLSAPIREDLLKDGCVYVPVGPKDTDDYDVLWRISFAKSERRLTLRMNYTQMLCYALLKLLVKEVLDKEQSTKDLFCSYFMKTCLFWLIEETDNDEKTWTISNLFHCFTFCLDKIIGWVNECHCPNYFIPENNMFIGKVLSGNRDMLLAVLRDFKSDGYQSFHLCGSLKFFETHTSKLSNAEREANLDLFCYRVVHIYPFDSMDLLQSALETAENLYKNETDTFTKGVINKFRATLHIEAAQMLQIKDIEKHPVASRFIQKDHLLKGCTVDVCSGLILLASFYLTQDKYYTALEIVHRAIQKLSPSFLLLRKPEYTEAERQGYIEAMCGRGYSLEEKIKSYTVWLLVLLDHSSVVPREFQIDVKNIRPLFQISPVTYAYAVRFLCYLHLHDSLNMREALRQLENVVLSKYFITERDYSFALTILGACHEEAGNVSDAAEYYDRALSNPPVCKSAKTRLDRLKN